MRLPRFTVRRLMVALAIVTILFGYVEHWIRCRILASRCIERALPHMTKLEVLPNRSRIYHGTDVFFRLMRKADEYDRAAWYPWLTVEPDPPEPE
jgi:hypothetical protein